MPYAAGKRAGARKRVSSLGRSGEKGSENLSWFSVEQSPRPAVLIDSECFNPLTHFINEELEAQRDAVTDSKPHS